MYLPYKFELVQFLCHFVEYQNKIHLEFHRMDFSKFYNVTQREQEHYLVKINPYDYVCNHFNFFSYLFILFLICSRFV